MEYKGVIDMGITISQKGDFSKTLKFLNSKKRLRDTVTPILEFYGQQGVEALKANTPRDTGKTAESWSYKIEHDDYGAKIIWSNSNTNKWANIAVLIQYGHATRNGGWVEGIDYINPAMKGIFETMAQNLWKEVTKG